MGLWHWLRNLFDTLDTFSGCKSHGPSTHCQVCEETARAWGAREETGVQQSQELNGQADSERSPGTEAHLSGGWPCEPRAGHSPPLSLCCPFARVELVLVNEHLMLSLTVGLCTHCGLKVQLLSSLYSTAFCVWLDPTHDSGITQKSFPPGSLSWLQTWVKSPS